MDCVYTDSDAQNGLRRRSGARAILKEEGIAEAMDKPALYIPTTRGKPDYLIPEEFDRLRGHVAQLDNVAERCRPRNRVPTPSLAKTAYASTATFAPYASLIPPASAIA